MAWTSILDLASWQIYVRYYGETPDPSPASRFSLVRAEDLDARVGTVTQNSGDIVLDLEPSADGQFGIQVVAMPSGSSPPTAPARVSVSFDGGPWESVESTSFSAVGSITYGGNGEYSIGSVGSFDDPISEGSPVTDVVSSDELTSGQGLSMSGDAVTSSGAGVWRVRFELDTDNPDPPDPPEDCDCSWMPYEDYTGFRVAVQHFIEGDDTVQGTFSTSTIDLLIRLGEQRTYRHLRASTMIERASLEVSDNAAKLPDCMLELKEVWFAGDRPLDIIPLERLRKLEADGFSGGVTSVAAQDAEYLRFWPPASGIAEISYYKKPCPLKTGDWSKQLTFARYPEIFIFAALSESAPFVGQDDRLPMWEAKFKDSLVNADQDERVRVYAGGPLRIRAR